MENTEKKHSHLQTSGTTADQTKAEEPHEEPTESHESPLKLLTDLQTFCHTSDLLAVLGCRSVKSAVHGVSWQCGTPFLWQQNFFMLLSQLLRLVRQPEITWTSTTPPTLQLQLRSRLNAAEEKHKASYHWCNTAGRMRISLISVSLFVVWDITSVWGRGGEAEVLQERTDRELTSWFRKQVVLLGHWSFRTYSGRQKKEKVEDCNAEWESFSFLRFLMNSELLIISIFWCSTERLKFICCCKAFYWEHLATWIYCVVFHVDIICIWTTSLYSLCFSSDCGVFVFLMYFCVMCVSMGGYCNFPLWALIK